MTCGIYSITNTKNGKRYIGSSVNIEKRWGDHVSNLRAKKHHSRHLQLAWNKYGEQVFRFELVAACDRGELIDQEQFWIDAFQTADGRHGYNIRWKADSNLGVEISAESRAKLSVSLRKAFSTPEARAKMSASMREVSARPGVRENRSASMKREWSNPDAKARRLSIIREVASRPEIRAKRTAALLGHECSSETRAKISKSLMGHEASEKAKAILVEAVQKRLLHVS